MTNHFTFNYKHILIDEIALNGLEGIGFDLLWKHFGKRISSQVTDTMKERFWNVIVNSKCVTFYKLPDPVARIEIFDRFAIVDEETGQLMEPDDYLDGPYEFQSVENEYGSCVHYKTRILIPKEQLQKKYTYVLEEFGDTLVMVASIEERWRALAGHMPIMYLKHFTPMHYCILELVGRSRENGQMTTGKKTNLTKIVKDPKFLFYKRKHLQKLDLVRVQCVTHISGGKGSKCLLLRLKRFHTPVLMTLPKVGKIHNLVVYLKNQPDHSEAVQTLIKKGMLTQSQSKKLQKTINVFSFEERQVTLEETDTKNKKPLSTKRKFIYLSVDSGESSQSEDEEKEEPLKCQYKIGVNLLRQAYERFIDAGFKGLTQIEMSQLLGVEFYTSRAVCRILKQKNVIREFVEDKGKQRTRRYIAVAAPRVMDHKYEKEKQRFMEYFNDRQIEQCDETLPSTSREIEPDPVPKKKVKVDTCDNENILMSPENLQNEITEVKVLEGLEKFHNTSLLSSKKKPTLRQLKFANGMLKVTREKLSISGYQTLSNMVSREIGEPPLDTKAVKMFVQKLVTDGQMKLLKVKWPGAQQRYTLLICAPHVKCTHSIIKAKYKEILMRSMSNKNSVKEKNQIENITRPILLNAYPRYMKIQKLHETLTKIIYFNDVRIEYNDMPEGFGFLVDIIPQFTVEFAIGNISNMAMSDIANLKIHEGLYGVKLCDTPQNIYKIVLQSKSLQTSIRINLKVLAMLGLIQLVSKSSQPVKAVDSNKSLLSYMIYVNRHAKIIDTRDAWPRDNVDLKSLEKHFYFSSFENVEKYWNTVYEISTNTTIFVENRDLRRNLTPPTRVQNEVQQHDNGEIYGDGMGPCGFDSSFFMEIPRLWRAFHVRMKTKQQSALKTLPRIKIPKKDKKVKPKAKSKKASAQKAPVEIVNKIITRKRISDAGIKWSKFEDNILMMCKAAITILSPTSQPGCLRLRNIVAKDILTLYDPKKCSSMCHRRSIHLESNTTLAHENKCLINELRRRRTLIQKYEGLFRKLRLRYSTNIGKLVNEAHLPMMELIWIISQVITSKMYNNKMPCVAMNFNEFHTKFSIAPSSANKQYNLYQYGSEGDPQKDSLKEGILQSVMLSHENKLNIEAGNKIYSVFKMYPETMLRTALDQLRKTGAIAAKDKLFNSHMHRFSFKDMVQSSHKISVCYRRKWSVRLNTEFGENLGKMLEIEIPQNNVKGSPEVNCLLSEMQTGGVVEVTSVTIPVISGTTGCIIQEEQLNVIDIETKYKLKSGLLGWKNKMCIKTFSKIYEGLYVEEYFHTIKSNALVKSPEEKIELRDKIVQYLKTKCEKGCTFNEIQETSGLDTKSLIDKLSELEFKYIIKRVGYYENRIILTEYSKPWTIGLENTRIIPAPWLTLEAEVQIEIFLKWAGVVVNRAFENPGSTVKYISACSEFITYRSVQDVCMYLEYYKCVRLHTMSSGNTDLFSNDDVVPELCDYNPYASPDNIFVFPLKDSLTRFSYIRRTTLKKLGKGELV